jgi:hypothetical protein
MEKYTRMQYKEKLKVESEKQKIKSIYINQMPIYLAPKWV